MKIVFITTFDILGPQQAGGDQCANRNLSLIRQVVGENNVYVCAITGNKEYLSKSSGNTAVFFSEQVSKTSKIKNVLSGRWMVGKKTEDAVLKHVLQLGCDVAVLDRSLKGFLPGRLPKEMKQILFMHNMEFDWIKRVLPESPKALLQMFPIMLNEADAVRNADIIISLNSRDAAVLKKDYRRSPNLILPITFDDNFVETGEDENQRSSPKLKLLFVGALFPPNEAGITWFIENVMPHVNAELTVAGRDFEKLADKLNRSNVKVIGTVDNLSKCYHHADAVVSPMLSGAGMKVKTAEALMYGKPMFATDEALEGYEVDGQKNVFRCNTPQEFISAINNYAGKPPYVPFDSDIRSLFLEKYHTPAYISILRNLLL